MLFFKKIHLIKMAHDKYSTCVKIDKYFSLKKKKKKKNGTVQKAHLVKKLWSWDFKSFFHSRVIKLLLSCA